MSITIRVEMADGWLENLRELEFEFLDERLGPDILADAKRYVPVDTGRLQNSLDYTILAAAGAAPELHVGSFDDDDGPVAYAAAVELGFHGLEFVRTYINHNFMGTGQLRVIPAHERRGNTPEQPYLRPALYQERY